MAAVSDSFKFSTLIWFLAGLFVPLWPITLPLCWYMAYRSYKKGTPLAEQIAQAQVAAHHQINAGQSVQSSNN